MGYVGILGRLIVFEVSSDKIFTFDNLQRTVSGRWTQHDVIGGKPVSEFLGPGAQRLTFEIFVSAMHGVNPRKTIMELEDAVERGEHHAFVLDGKKIGKHEWAVESVSETWGEVMEGGKLLSAHLMLTLLEYT